MENPPGRSVFTTSTGELVIQIVTPKIIRTRIRGMLDASVLPDFVRILDAWSDPHESGLCSFHDWENMTSYDPAGRLELTTWTLKRRRKFAAVHFLLRSSLVTIGVQAANLALGGFMTVHKERRKFEEALAKASEGAPQHADLAG